MEGFGAVPRWEVIGQMEEHQDSSFKKDFL